MLVSLSLLGLLAAQETLAARVVEMELRSRPRTTPSKSKRSFTQSLQNYLSGLEYFAAISVGTPPQDLELIVDTGSSDVWFFAPGACVATKQSPCIGGSFDSSKSSTYKLVGQNQFQISYADQSGVKGDYIMDAFSIGGQNISSLMMAVATTDSGNQAGIMGIGLDTRESIQNYGGSVYPNLPDTLKSTGLIGTKAYSLYLDDQESATGSVLFGGYDTAKFYGDLTLIDLVSDNPQTGEVTSFSVPWVSMAVSNANGTYAIKSADMPAAVTLDSGSTLISVPTDIFTALAKVFNVDTQSTLVSCNLMKETGYVSFGFGNAKGPVIAVPFSELARPLYNGAGEWETDSNGEKACEFGIADAGSATGSSLLFGQTLLRSAYVLYDLDNMRVGIAQARYGSTTSSIIEYDGSNTQNIVSLSGAVASATAGGASASSPFLATSIPFITNSAVPSGVGFSSIVGGETIVAGVVAVPTTLSVSQPAVPNPSLANPEASLTSLGSTTGGAMKSGEGAGILAVGFAALVGIFGAGVLFL